MTSLYAEALSSNITAASRYQLSSCAVKIRVCSVERRFPGLPRSFPWQVYASSLASESSSRAVQAELALAKRDAAQAASSLKSAMATWHSELEWQKAEVRGLGFKI